MGRHQANNKKLSLNEDLGFRFSTPAPSQQHQHQQHQQHQHYQRPRSNSYNSNRRRNNNNSSNNNKSSFIPQDRTAARRKANSAMFYLHTSADHVFYLTRQNHHKLPNSNRNNSNNQYSFSGSDNPVSWESVRIVKQLVPIDDKVNKTAAAISSSSCLYCPICLDDDFTCARITKCGHTFCLPCILHHVQSSTNPNHHVKCPCCSIPILMDDLRPVQIETTQSPQLQKTIRLVKLHRDKTCSTPYIPIPGFPKHCSPNAAPCMGDPDERYSRFSYVDPLIHQKLLMNNQEELNKKHRQYLTSSSSTTTKTESGGGISSSSTSLEQFFLKMALEVVTTELRKAKDESTEEMILKEAYRDPIKGFYQPQKHSKSLYH